MTRSLFTLFGLSVFPATVLAGPEAPDPVTTAATREPDLVLVKAQSEDLTLLGTAAHLVGKNVFPDTTQFTLQLDYAF